MGKVKVAVVGVGNCASALIQGVHFYKDKKPDEAIGLVEFKLGGLVPGDIEFVLAIDVDSGKVGKDLSEAIYQPPNNTVRIADVPNLGVEVKKGPVLDGIGKYISEKVTVSKKQTVNVSKELRDSGA